MASEILKKSWPYMVIILAHTIWGVNFVVAKLALQEIPPMTLAFLRFTIAFLFLLPFLWIEKEKMRIDKNDLPMLFTVGVLMTSLNIALFYLGLIRTTVITASMLTMTIPVLSVILGWIFLKEKVYVVNLLGIGLGFLGAILVIGLPFFFLGEQFVPKIIFGNLLIVLASLSWVIGAILSKKILQKYSTLTLTTIIFAVGWLTFAIPAWGECLADPTWFSKLTILGFFGLVYIAIASSICAYFLFEWGLARLGVIKSDLFQYIEPLIAITLGIIILQENLRFSYVIGAILIILGVYFSTLIKEHHKHHKAHRI